MNNAGATSGIPSQTANTDLERRWPAMAVFLTAWWLPATTARRTAHVSLLNAWLIHLPATLLTILLIMLLVAWAEPGRGVRDIDEAFVQFLYMLLKIDQQFVRHPYVSSAALAGIILSIEIGHLLLALLVMPWGAHDEPLRNSYRNALRHTWLRTAHVLPCVLLVGTVSLALHNMQFEWLRANPAPKRPVQPPAVAVATSDSAYEQAVAEYEAAVVQYREQMARAQEAWKTWAAQTPWHVTYSVPLAVQTAFITALWLLWGLFRGVGASRHTPLIERPPMCEACGYNLSTIPMESRCPRVRRSGCDFSGTGCQAGNRMATGTRTRTLGCVVAMLCHGGTPPTSARPATTDDFTRHRPSAVLCPASAGGLLYRGNRVRGLCGG